MATAKVSDPRVTVLDGYTHMECMQKLQNVLHSPPKIGAMGPGNHKRK